MNTNLISTPEITGNIGSCKTHAQVVIIDQDIITKDIKTITTNSCTGETNHYDAEVYTNGAGIVMGSTFIITLIAIYIVICTIVENSTNQ